MTTRKSKSSTTVKVDTLRDWRKEYKDIERKNKIMNAQIDEIIKEYDKFSHLSSHWLVKLAVKLRIIKLEEM